jgi:hypothetical protein
MRASSSGDPLNKVFSTDLAPDASVPVLSHETLSEMVGTTRSRITHFMNKFRTMGLIDYNGELTIRTELLTDLVLHPCKTMSVSSSDITVTSPLPL